MVVLLLKEEEEEEDVEEYEVKILWCIVDKNGLWGRLLSD